MADQIAGGVLLVRRDSVLQVENDAVGMQIQAVHDHFWTVSGKKQHASTHYDTASLSAARRRAVSNRARITKSKAPRSSAATSAAATPCCASVASMVRRICALNLDPVEEVSAMWMPWAQGGDREQNVALFLGACGGFCTDVHMLASSPKVYCAACVIPGDGTAGDPGRPADRRVQ